MEGTLGLARGGIGAVVLKPYRAEELGRVVRTTLDRWKQTGSHLMEPTALETASV